MNPYTAFYRLTLLRIAFWYITPKDVRKHAKAARKAAKEAGKG